MRSSLSCVICTFRVPFKAPELFDTLKLGISITSGADSVPAPTKLGPLDNAVLACRPKLNSAVRAALSDPDVGIDHTAAIPGPPHPFTDALQKACIGESRQPLSFTVSPRGGAERDLLYSFFS